MASNVARTADGTHRARYVGPDGRRRSKTFRTVADARAWLRVQQGQAAQGTWRPPADQRATVGAAFDRYLQRGLRPSTLALYRATWRTHLAGPWGARTLASVTAADVRDWWDSADAGPTARAQAYRLLRAVFADAVEREVIPASPVRIKGASTPAVRRPSRALTRVEIAAVAAEVPERYAALVLTMAYGALRIGEAAELRRGDLVLDAAGAPAALRVERAVSRGVVGEPKTAAGRRVVALPPSVSLRLAEHLATFSGDGPAGLVFPTRTGGQVQASTWGHTFARAVERAGLPPTRSHELRHSGATMAVGAGATVRELQARLGHASAAMALRYTHASAERDAEIAAALDG